MKYIFLNDKVQLCALGAIFRISKHFWWDEMPILTFGLIIAMLH